ncbi:hypothetical protein SI65_03062 [Aspergillus cristatus]|uniref:Mating alpha-pheromone PpgA n=1 Tax=Aspergillus cristatus TaxID=573508 RepID=A0A1E3BPA3_ASPCR|nr:hypothetical protein SI65_03062 [Aspergillus cristatus]
MKFTLTALAAMMAATVVHAAAIPGDGDWCGLPGQPCGQMKRAVSGASEVKRSADALAEAIKEMPKLHIPSWCALPGQICSKFKRAAKAADDVKRSADALTEAAAAVESH